jgi:hypothetical protein
VGRFASGNDGDRADERDQKQDSCRLDRHEMPSEQLAAEPRNVILSERIGGSRDSTGRTRGIGRRCRGRVACDRACTRRGRRERGGGP